MRNQLQKFTDFANSLLPQETAHLLSVQQFHDPVRTRILELVDHNARHIDQFTPYDTAIDKRKYHHLQTWIQQRLRAIDVDAFFDWMLDMERKIMADSITFEEERALLLSIRKYRHPGFFFAKFYEVVEMYRNFLMIRLRYNDHKKVHAFIQTYRDAYLATKEIRSKLHDATRDIVTQYSDRKTETRQWIEWLTEVFYDESIDGYNRYLAMVRLVFINHNYRSYDQVREKFDFLEKKFRNGEYYSKRILINYANNRLMMHSHFKEYDQAAYYGYLSIRTHTHDYLLYVNNLCAVLLRLKRYQEALALMQKASTDAKRTKNFHNRVGYVAFYMESLNKNGMYKNAIGYGDAFLKAYAREVIQYRWHLFFSVYLEAQMHLQLFEQVLTVARKYQLAERDTEYRDAPGYTPIIPMLMDIASYRAGLIGKPELLQRIERLGAEFRDDIERSRSFRSLLQKAGNWIPGIPVLTEKLVL